MGERDLSRLSDAALADCFGRLNSERAATTALCSTVRDEILRRSAKSFNGSSFTVSVSSVESCRWDLEAVSKDLGERAELFRWYVSTTYVRSRAMGFGKEMQSLGRMPDIAKAPAYRGTCGYSVAI